MGATERPCRASRLLALPAERRGGSSGAEEEGRERDGPFWLLLGSLFGLTSGLGQPSPFFFFFFSIFVLFISFPSFAMVPPRLCIWKVSHCLILLLLMRETQLVIL
jgi:hypothetical protein